MTQQNVLRLDEIYQNRPIQPPPSDQEVQDLWGQARGELYGFALAMDRRGQSITAAQLRMAVALADQAVQLRTRPDLFQQGDYTLHSGGKSSYKIECDALNDREIATLAMIGSELLPPFAEVLGIPTGGVKFASAMSKYKSERGPTLICDDVVTTGRSFLDAFKNYPTAIGCSMFARGPCPAKVVPLLYLNNKEIVDKVLRGSDGE